MHRSVWKQIRPWASLLLMGLIFGWMFHKIALHWQDVRARAGEISEVNFVIASFLFAFFLFAFRSLLWRRILKRMGHPLTMAPAVRIWSSSELARYIPGVIWQMAGRVYLVRPYGVSGAVCAASQILELVLFLLANILLGLGCLVVFGLRHISGPAQHWMFILAASVPLLVLLIHPAVFYGLMNRILRRMNKPRLTQRLRASELMGMLFWNMAGLLLQSAAVFLIVRQPLGLHWDKCYVVAGAYCLAWCAGFLAVLNPGGLGVREAVFVAALQFALPYSVQGSFGNKAALIGFLTFLSGLLRLWTIAGELVLSGLAHLADRKAVLGRRYPQSTPIVLNSGTLPGMING